MTSHNLETKLENSCQPDDELRKGDRDAMKKTTSLVPVKVLYWSSQVSTMSIELALCIGVGYWADLKQGTSPLYLLLGCLVGFVLATWHLYQLVSSLSKPESKKAGLGKVNEDRSQQGGISS